MTLNPHLRSHLLAFWLAVVAVVLGLLLMITPAAGEDSPSLAIMPPVGMVFWGLWFAVGGGAVLVGLVGLKRRWEASGSVLLGFSYFSAILSGLFAGTATLLGVLFLLAISVGFWHRAYFLVRDSADAFDNDNL